MPKLTAPTAMTGPEFTSALKEIGLTPAQFAALGLIPLSSVYAMQAGKYRISGAVARWLHAWRIHPDLIPPEYRPAPKLAHAAPLASPMTPIGEAQVEPRFKATKAKSAGKR